MKNGNQTEKETTSGIGPTINFWWEEAYENSFGLALGFMYIDFARESESIGKGQRMELWKLGFEGKHDPLQGDKVFFALGYFKKHAENPGIPWQVKRKWRIFRDRLGVSF